MFNRQKVAVMGAEFFGTAVLTLVILAVANRLGIQYFVAIAAAAVLTLMTMVMGGVSGAHFNPAVTAAMWSAKRIETLQAVVYIAVQMLGGLAAMAVYELLTEVQLTTTAAEFDWRVLGAEAIGAMIFAFGAAAVTQQRNTDGGQAVIVGLSFAVGIIVASLASNGLINPAVALGTQSWSWAYVAGPVLGALVGVHLYNLLFVMPVKVVAKRVTTKKTVVKKRK